MAPELSRAWALPPMAAPGLWQEPGSHGSSLWASIWDHLPQESLGRMWFALDSLSTYKRGKPTVFFTQTPRHSVSTLLVFSRKTWWSQRKYDNKWNTLSFMTSKTGSKKLKWADLMHLIPQITKCMCVCVCVCGFCVHVCCDHTLDTFTFLPSLSLNVAQDLLSNHPQWQTDGEIYSWAWWVGGGVAEDTLFQIPLSECLLSSPWRCAADMSLQDRTSALRLCPSLLSSPGDTPPGQPWPGTGRGGGELLGPAHARLLCQAVFAQKLLVRLARMATQGSPCPASCPVISQGCYLPSTNTPPALLPPPQLPLPTALHWQTPYLCIFPVSQSGSIINVNG